jgi:hypothetical protein
MLWFYAVTTALCSAQPLAVTPQWQVTFPPVAKGVATRSMAVPTVDGTVLVAVVTAGSDPMKPVVQAGSRTIPAQLIGFDSVSRLEFIKVEGSEFPKSLEWNASVGANASASLRTMESGGSFDCRSTGWVQQLGPKILPFALLRVSFSRPVPPPGTPLVDSAGKVVGLVFQGSGNDNNGYAIPAEAVHRVRKDLLADGKMVRGWIGIGLRSESQLPQLSRVLSGSPAEKVGIRENDVILSIGSRPVRDYVDAVNAFFYLVPGQPVGVKLLRKVEQLDFTVTPDREPNL